MITQIKANKISRSYTLADDLWRWEKTIETIGKILLVVNIIIGLIVSFGIPEGMSKSEGSYNIGLFFILIICSVCLTFVEYILFKIAALAVGALASVVQNTSYTAWDAAYTSQSCEKAAAYLKYLAEKSGYDAETEESGE